eukprot:jgi/Ulvmu1/1808/UM119_0026.1
MAQRLSPARCNRLHPRVRLPARSRTVFQALDPDNASIMVCGGAGVALSTTRIAKDMGAWVWMMQRTDKLTSDIEKMMAFKVKGDAMDKASVAKAMSSIDGLDAVVCTIGGTLENPQVDSEGNINVINAAIEAGVKKFVLVTSIGTGDSKDAPAQQVYDTLKPVLLEKGKAEDALKAQDKMDWVIIRPGGLTNDPATGKWFVTENPRVCGAIAREDVAELVCKALFSDKVNNKVISALDADRVQTTVEYEAIDL